MRPDKHINSTILIAKMKKQFEVLTNSQAEIAVLDRVIDLIQREPAVNREAEGEDTWELVDLSPIAVGNRFTRTAFRHAACGELITMPKPFCPNCGKPMKNISAKFAKGAQEPTIVLRRKQAV